jgi:hypothetical protein
MLRWLVGSCAAVLLAAPAVAEEVTPPPSQRFVGAESTETVSFRRHVMPLLGRLGCNGRACHGSFKGQGGFRLSLFGYDFQADHAALTGGARPRIDVQHPDDSLILKKPTRKLPHRGGKRLEPGSWQFRLLRHWIEDGARNDAKGALRLLRLSVLPDHHVFRMQGETVQLRVVARWSDGTVEDVTELARFRSNDDAVAAVSESGLVTAARRGDTHVVAFYDNGIAPVPVMLPVSDLVGARYPDVPAPTKIDQLVTAKLRDCGIVPSEPAGDAEFLRRVSLDLTGTLPTGAEVEAFLADRAADKRARKIDELLDRPAYAVWWATKLCDYAGNSGRYREARFGPVYARQWYDWVYRRVRENVGYDEIVAGMVLATGRKAGQSLEDYSREMSSYCRQDHPADFSLRPTMPHYWSRISFEDPRERALGFSYAFLGVHLQCAECHKHPFDQWTKKDFEQFTAIFARIVYGTPPEDRARYVQMAAAVTSPAAARNGKQADAQFATLVQQGKTIPWHEVYVAQPGDNGRIKGPLKPAAKKKALAKSTTRAKLLGGAEIGPDAPEDLRGILMSWLQRPDNPYFAKAFVNRVWAGYFNVGIIEPPDDLSLANPPSNAALLDYLTHGFVAHGYDMKWLHREITSSRTYQRSWKPNATNRLDARNFSHALPRRLPAEVAYDAIYQATAAPAQVAGWQADAGQRAIGVGLAASPKARGKVGNILTVFGKPDRIGNCDCGRANDPSLLQTLFLLNDGEIQGMLTRPGGWVAQLAKPAKVKKGPANSDAARAKAVAKLQRRIEDLRKQGHDAEASRLEPGLRALQQAAKSAKFEPRPRRPDEERQVIREAFLRTVSRLPTEKEFARARAYLQDSASIDVGLRDLLWALINTKEFLLNH